MTDEAQGIPRDITPEEVCRLVTGALYPKEMALLQETQRQLDEERRMLDETRERCKALESELSSARMRIDKPLRDAWLGEAIAALAERVPVRPRKRRRGASGRRRHAVAVQNAARGRGRLLPVVLRHPVLRQAGLPDRMRLD